MRHNKLVDNNERDRTISKIDSVIYAEAKRLKQLFDVKIPAYMQLVVF